MATLAEKIAAKRALAEQTPSIAETVFDTVKEEPKEEETTMKVEPVLLGKPLTFMEQMALKKELAAAKNLVSIGTPVNASAQTVKSLETQQQKPLHVVSSLSPQTIITKEEQATNVIAPALHAVKPLVASVLSTEPSSELKEEPDLTDVPMVDQQAYRDIKAKLDLLEDMSEVNLKDAMTDLKKALLKNPQACYLILPQEVGQMVIALRRMKNEDVVTAEKVKKEPGAKRGKASKALTAEEIATAFDEL